MKVFAICGTIEGWYDVHRAGSVAISQQSDLLSPVDAEVAPLTWRDNKMNPGQPDQANPDDETNPDTPRKLGQSDEIPTVVSGSGDLSATAGYDPHSTQFHGEQVRWIGQLPEYFGRYKVLRPLDKGGMGAVYLAEDIQLDRQVAIKVPFQSADGDADVLNRFAREAKSLAAIVHPNICPIHEVGEMNGIHFLAMTYVEGKPLSDYIRSDKPLSIKQAVLLVRKLAWALHYAHAAGVIHRDLKPANIMINKLKEPIIMDFGLARREGKSDAAVTMLGDIMGTPAYMSPEQFAGDIAAMGPGCDVYSLGVILFELLTAKRPIDGNLPEIRSKIFRVVPLPPSRLRNSIDGQLDLICMKALEKKVEDRFASMAEFTEVLSEYLKTEQQRRASGATLGPRQRGGTVHASDTTKAHSAINGEGDDTVASEGEADDEEGSATTLLPVGEGYRLVKTIGTGQYGEVWLGMAPGGIEVAVKKILFPLGHRATQSELQALELMKRLRHSFLVQVQAYWVMEDQLMIVMELADGSLEERAAECRRETGGGIPRDELLGYMREASEAIDFLHGEQVLHRDIKPGNILLVKGHVKVADFGIATAGVLGHDQMTTTSTTLGTPLYMGPELWDGQAGPRSDQYSLAVTYVELRTGARPALDDKHLPDLSALPEEEQAVLGKATAADPSNRFENCSQFAQALDEIVENERRAAEEQVRSERQQVIDRRRRKRTRIVVGLTLVAMLTAGWFIRQAMLRPALMAADKLKVTAGATASLEVRGGGYWKYEQIDVTLQGHPAGITYKSTTTEEGLANVSVTADLQCPSSETKITLIAKAGEDEELRQTILLTVEQADYYLPEHCEPAEGAVLIDGGGKILYDRIDRIIHDDAGDIRVQLLLIQQGRANDPATFYCMKNKVSNRLFKIFVNRHPETINADSQWERGAWAGTKWMAAAQHPENPVFSVSVKEAHDFAVWFGGLLPTVDQWDKAAGLWDHDEGVEGPYRGSWGTTAVAGEIAVDQLLAGPLPVGSAALDIGSFGCRDMAGNGREWTRNLADIFGRTVPIDPPNELDFVTLRGCSYVRFKPRQYRDLKDETSTETAAYIFSDDAADVSFRCVIEP